MEETQDSKSNNPVTKKIINENQVGQTIKELNDFRKKGLFCDFTIFLPDKSKYLVHKTVIAAGSPYFKSLFNYENANKISETIPKDIPPKIFENILEFIYTGETEIGIEDALILHETATYFLLNTLKERVSTIFLIDNVQIDTILKYWRGAVFDDILLATCEEFIAQNAKEFFEIYLFDLTFKELNKILSNKFLNCPEEELYFYVIKWIKKDYKNRENKFNDLLKNLRFCSISDNVKVKLVEECGTVIKSLLVLANYFKKNSQSEQSMTLSYKSLGPRIGALTQNMIAVDKTTIYKLDKNQKFSNLQNITRTDGFQINNFSENYLLLSGGTDSKLCEYYCPLRNIVKTFPDMIESRSNHGIVTLKDVIYAAGGSSSLTTSEQFDLGSETWIQGANLNYGRKNFSLLSWNNSIYAFGGDSKIIERLDPRENMWLEITPSTNYPFNTNFTKSMVVDDSIYCFSNDSMYIFEMRQNNWISDFKFSLTHQGYTISAPTGIANIYFDKSIYMMVIGGSCQYRCTSHFYKCDKPANKINFIHYLANPTSLAALYY